MRAFVLIFFLACAAVANSQSQDKLSEKAAEAQSFCKKNNMNGDFCFLMDLSIHSGKNRFYIYDFKTQSVKSSGLVCHGIGKNSTVEKPVYSNEPGSYCTSLGKYKTGARGYIKWGTHVHYRLHGLEKTNSNALKRQVVLHSYEEVPENEVYPQHLPLGWSLGCPVVSDNIMTQIDSLLKVAKKPTLLWIFE
jgi:hypothetical protein